MALFMTRKKREQHEKNKIEEEELQIQKLRKKLA